jgi:hypothetical protein
VSESHDPDHYKVGGIESIDVIRAKLSPEAYRGFCLGNAMKYVHRAGHKDAAVDDAKKAIVYLEWFAESLDGPSPVAWEVRKTDDPVWKWAVVSVFDHDEWEVHDRYQKEEYAQEACAHLNKKESTKQ